MRATKMELICDGKIVNEHSERGRNQGWSNPIEILPPIGSTIEYLTFNQNHKEGQGVLTKYVVKGYTFTTEEDFNSAYSGKVCKIEVNVMSQSD